MHEEVKDIAIYSSVKENMAYIKGLLKDNSDVVYREFFVGNRAAALIYIDGMADKILLDNFVLETLMVIGKEIKDAKDIKDKFLTVSDVKEEEKLNKGINAFLSGDTLMLVEDLKIGYIIATRSWPARSVSEPMGETTVKGPREGFTETIRMNTALVRRRIRDTRFKIVPKPFGVRSKTDGAIMYIDDIVNREVLEETMKRLDTIHIDAVLGSGYVRQLIEDGKFSPFPTIQSTERPDVVAAALYEGKVAILVDNSPFAIIVPATLPALFQSPDDYYEKWIHASTIRIVRFLALLFSLVMTPLYVAITSYHPGIIPTKLAYSIAATRESVPFPSAVEAVFMELSLALLVEAVVRLPRPIGSTIGIVGGVIIGQAAVSAGLVSPIMVIIVSITAMSSFITPNYEITYALRIVRFVLLGAAAALGLYGIMIGLILFMVHLCKLRSFGVPYLAPLVSPNVKDFKDLFIRMPLQYFKERPIYMDTKDKIRQK